jgi:hypothetical protein
MQVGGYLRLASNRRPEMRSVEAMRSEEINILILKDFLEEAWRRNRPLLTIGATITPFCSCYRKRRTNLAAHAPNWAFTGCRLLVAETIFDYALFGRAR